MAKLVPFQPPPGVWANGTAYEAKGRWNDSNLVRWKNGRLQPLGGWEKAIGATLSGVGRAMLAWKDYSGTQWLAIGTNEKLYVFTSLSGSAEDITPVIASPNSFITGNSDAELGLGFGAGDFSGTETIQEVKSDSTNTSGGASGQISIDRETDKILTTKATSAKIFTDGATSASAPGVGPSPFGVGDQIEISGSSQSSNNRSYTGAGGLTTGSHRIYDFPTTKSMRVGPKDGSAAYTSSDSDKLVADDPGETITITRTRRFGNENAETSSLVLEASSWIFDLWGEKLVGMSTSDGKLYEWNPSATNPTGTVATVISGAPVNNYAMLVSKERHMFALGASGNNRLIMWSDTDDNTDWTPTNLNQSGSFHIDTSGQIMGGKTVGDRILVWTTTDLHAINWIGPPYVYGRKKIGDACGAISNRSMVAVGDQAFWMSPGGFFQYQGSVQPLECDVSAHVFGDINKVQDSKIYASVNQEFFEVTWWYASADSEEILKYVTYNYKERWWSIGELCRTAWVDSGVFDDPIAIADDNKIYVHEQAATTASRTTQQVAQTVTEISDYERKLVTGTSSTTDAGLCFAETGGMEVGEAGDNIAHITQLVTDSTQGDNGLRFKFKTSMAPNSTESTSAIYDVAADGYTDIRETGRQFKFRVESPFDQTWSVGKIRANISTGGKR